MTVRDPGYGRRHPLCPHCGYDLVVTVDEGRRTCPECGNPFDLGELRHEVRAGDWTIWRGIGRAALVLCAKGVICAAVWAILVWGAAALPALAGPSLPPLLNLLLTALCGLLVLAGGATVGWVLARGLVDDVGFTGAIPIVLATAFAWAAIAAGGLAARLLGGAAAPSIAVLAVCGVLALGLIVRTILMEEF
jgi:hypothetical protein